NLPKAGEIPPNELLSGRRGAAGAAGASGAAGSAGAGGSGERPGDSDGRLVGWAPGEAPLALRLGQAKLVKKGSVLIFQIHYVTNGEPGSDRSSVGLIFSKDPVEKRVITAGATQPNFAIPPGDPNYEVKSEFVFRDDSHIDSVHPHMHVR